MDIVTPENKKESYRLFDKIAKTYDLLNIILSLGIDRIWRRKITKLIGNSKIENAVDLATGTADMAILLGKKKNITQVLGLDMSKEMIGIGKQKVLRGKLAQKVTLEIGDGMNIPLESSSQDLITITFGIRNYGDYMKGLREMHRILKEKGRCIIMEFSLPKNFLIKKFYLFYFRKFLPLIGRIISKDDMAYTYLNKTVESFPYGEHFSEKMKEAGFSNIKIHELTLGIASIYVAEK